MRRAAPIVLVLSLVLAGGAPPAPAAGPAIGDPDVAALQVGLRAQGLYSGNIDGLLGPMTEAGVHKLQARAGLAGHDPLHAETRAALGPFGGSQLGSRILAAGMSGWDVAALEFLLAWHGFPSGELSGRFGLRTEAALLRFQRWAGLPQVGTGGPATLSALRGPLPRSPIRLKAPLAVPFTDRFGPRGTRFHAGIDFPAKAGTPVVAAGSGRVVHAGWSDGGWGTMVRIAHRNGVSTLYAHLSNVAVRVGDRVESGQAIGLVGASGRAFGPNLHFEVWLRGAAVDPLTAIA